MEKIYSRKRINLPKIYFSKIPNGKNDLKKQKMLEISIILIIAIFIMTIMIKGINPIIDRICLEESRKKATIVSNQKATEVMKDFTYQDMIDIYRDNDGNVKMIKSNIVAINAVTSDVAVKIQEEFEKDNESTVNLKFGSLLGTKVLSGIGPNIKLKVSTSGNVTTKIRSEFENAGINQTIHRLYLDVTCNVSILTPYNVIEDSIQNEIVLIENVIVGLVPSTYYNLEGIDKNNIVDIIE